MSLVSRVWLLPMAWYKEIGITGYLEALSCTAQCCFLWCLKGLAWGSVPTVFTTLSLNVIHQDLDTTAAPDTLVAKWGLFIACDDLSKKYTQHWSYPIHEVNFMKCLHSVSGGRNFTLVFSRFHFLFAVGNVGSQWRYLPPRPHALPSVFFPPSPVSTPTTATPGFTGLTTHLCLLAESEGHVCWRNNAHCFSLQNEMKKINLDALFKCHSSLNFIYR